MVYIFFIVVIFVKLLLILNFCLKFNNYKYYFKPTIRNFINIYLFIIYILKYAKTSILVYKKNMVYKIEVGHDVYTVF
jgi:hypothetical protein